MLDYHNTRLEEVAESLVSDKLFTRDKRSTFDAFATLIKHNLGCESCAIFLNQGNDMTRIILESSLTDLFGYNYEHGITFKKSRQRKCGLTAFLATERQPVRLSGTALSKHPSRAGRTPKHLADGMCRSILSLPICDSAGGLQGYVKCENKRQKASFTVNDEKAGVALADYLARGMEMHDHFENFCVTVLGLQGGSSISAALTEFLSVARMMIGNDGGVLLLADKTTRTLRCAATLGCGRAFSPREFQLRWKDTSIASHVLHTKKPFFHRDIKKCGYAHSWGIRRFRIKGAVIGAPIVYKGRRYGAIVVWSKAEKNVLRKHHESDLLSVAELAGPFIERHYKLKEALARVHSFVHNLGVGLFRKDIDLRITYCNAYYQRLLKMPVQDILGKTDRELFLRELARKFRKDDRLVITTGKEFQSIEQNIDPVTGHRILVDVVKKPLLNNDGKVSGIDGTFLRLRPEYYDLFSQSERLAKSGSWEWDSGSNEFSASLNYWMLLGLPPPTNPDIEEHFCNYLSLEAKRWLGTLRGELATTGQVPLEMTLPFTLSDGSTRMMLVRAQNLTKNPRKVMKVYGTLQDMTDAVYAELHRTRRAGLETFRRMAGEVAHDTLTQFQTIRTSLETLQLGCDERETKAIADRALRAYADSFSVLRELTNEAQTGARAFEACDLNDLIEKYVRSREHDLRQSGIVIARAFALEHLNTSIIVSDINRVIGNLVQNAIDAMPHGGTITIATRYVTKPEVGPADGDACFLDRWIEVDFIDTGKGIQEDLRASIFGHKFTTKTIEGAGFGLKSAKRIMKIHGGWINLLPKSQAQGAAFRLLFPFIRTKEHFNHLT